jgi:hypothetical protein
MLPYLIAGAIGFAVAKLFEEDETPKYDDGGQVDTDIPRYLYHTTPYYNYQNIKKNGLSVGFDNRIYFTKDLGSSINIANQLYQQYHKNEDIEFYHIWRIDTKKINNPIFFKDEDYNAGIYITEPIPKNAIRYYESTRVNYADGGSVLLAPNGKPSNLTPEQYKLVRKPEFKAWFGDWENDPETASKVVDENGEPLVVYHGSDMDFNVFKKGRNNPYAEKPGYFFAYNKKYSASFNSKYIKDYFLNLRIRGRYDDDDVLIPSNADGLIIEGLQIEIFDNKNIKLADGTNTTFDGNNPDIRFDGGGEVFYHGSTDKNLEGKKGIHIGTKLASTEALESRIGVPSKGEWDGKRKYGKTLLAGKKRLKELEKERGYYLVTGYNTGRDIPEEDYYPNQRKERAVYSDGTPIPFDSKPIVFPVKIKGRMTNSKYNPHTDDKANSMMLRNLKMGNAKSGYYYTNIAEDEGSISAVVPDKSFIEIIDSNTDIRFDGGGSVEELKFSNEIESDAMGYDIGDYLYHITPVSNFDTIINKGFIPKNGISINGKPFENRLYFATSLISAYDLSVNFGSYRDDKEYVIFKIKSDCIDDYEEDNLFAHGIYVDYKISNQCIIGYVNANDLFNKFDDEDIENLYY